MVNIIVFRKERLLKKKAFSDEKEINSHIQYIETENTKLDKISRMRELENWLNYLNLE
jgi:GMP synthase (glutamine-hydrolysing)